MTASALSPLRQLIENRLSQLTTETETLFADARERARRETADQLNQAVRRIRQAGGLDELCATLSDAAGAFASTAILFRVEGDTARSDKLEIALDSAAAMQGAIETRDLVIAAASGSEVSPQLFEVLGQPADGRVFIFPVVVKDAVPALLCAWGEVLGSSVELLTQVAAASWAAPTAPVAEEPDLITIQGIVQPADDEAPAPAAQEKPAAPDTPARDGLPLEEQRLHLNAQRFARVQVAEMRLFSADAVYSGRESQDLYEGLRQPLDRARETFRTQFLANCPSMVDYLHLEVVRTLANDNPELLGKTYPGPLV